MFSKRIYFFAVPLLVAALAANLPRTWVYGQTAQERAREVLSAFINLGSDPPPSLVNADWLVRNERLKLLRERRLAHVPPALIRIYAKAEGITEAAFRTRLIDPLRDDPFETAKAALRMPQEMQELDADGLSWAIVTSEPDDPETKDQPACGLWLVFWDQQNWFYAPVGTEVFYDRLITARPDFRNLPLAASRGCKTDD